MYEPRYIVQWSNGNDIEAKANECFDDAAFFDFKAKRTCSLLEKNFSRRNEQAIVPYEFYILKRSEVS
jgi:hypothetical protein